MLAVEYPEPDFRSLVIDSQSVERIDLAPDPAAILIGLLEPVRELLTPSYGEFRTGNLLVRHDNDLTTSFVDASRVDLTVGRDDMLSDTLTRDLSLNYSYHGSEGNYVIDGVAFAGDFNLTVNHEREAAQEISNFIFQDSTFEQDATLRILGGESGHADVMVTKTNVEGALNIDYQTQQASVELDIVNNDDAVGDEVYLQLQNPGGETRLHTEGNVIFTAPEFIGTGIDPTAQQYKSFVVTNTLDSGEGSLRAAIEAANAWTEDGLAVITFAIPETDPGAIDLDGSHDELPLLDLAPGSFIDQPSMSVDGSRIAFVSAADLTGENPNGNLQIFLFNVETGQITQLSDPAMYSWVPIISRDGSHVTFLSENARGAWVLFLADTATGLVTQIAQTTADHGSNLSKYVEPSISSDGTLVAFTSDQNLDPSVGNADGLLEAFLYDAKTDTIRQVTDSADGECDLVLLDAAGTKLVFTDSADLTPTTDDLGYGLYVYDLTTQQTTSLNISGEYIAMNADATRVSFQSVDDLDPSVGNADGNIELFYLDVGAGVHQVTDTTGLGAEISNSMDDVGRYISFGSRHDLAGENPERINQAFVYDTLSGTFEQLTHGDTRINRTYTGISVRMSPDGSSVLYGTHDADPAGNDNLVQATLTPDVFVISPLTQLPALTRGDIVINGQSQQNLTGDTNPFGPEIVLEGSSAVGQSELPGLVSHYRFNGTVEDDAGDNEPSATSGIHFVEGQIGQGVTFDPGGYIEIPDSEELDQQIFTLSAWVRPEGPGPNGDFHGSVIIGKNLPPSLGNTTVSVQLSYSSQTNRFLFGFGNVFTESGRIVSSNTFAPGQYHHVAGTYDGTTFKLYVNGQLEGELALTKTIDYSPFVPWTIGSSAYPFRAVNYARTWNGVIDEVGIYNQALSAAEIESLAMLANGLVLSSSNNLVHGLNIQQFSGDGIFVGGNYNTLTGNSIGTNDRRTIAPRLLGPTPYLSFDDSPFRDFDFSQFYLEDFEDGALNVPGVIATNNKPGGSLLGVFGPERGYVDSVDADDGVIDGSGLSGHSFAALANDGGDSYGHKYEFDASVLGGLPTHVGIVWTDGNVNSTTLFEAFGPSGEPLGIVGPVKISDASVSGTTSEDRFFGVIDPRGISKIVLRNPGGNSTLEIDHLQYGFADPTSNAGWEYVINDGGNGGDGVRIVSSIGNMIGGTTESSRNVISGNGGNGIQILGDYVPVLPPGLPEDVLFIPLPNVVQGNYIGTTSDGMSALANVGDGIRIVDSSGNLIGGPGDFDRNVISGNDGEGIKVIGEFADENVIQGNYIGLNASGTDAIGNRLSGIFIPGATNTDILDNVVSGNLGFAGIAIYGGNPATGDATGTVIQGNYVGTNAVGDQAVPNLGEGISINDTVGSLIGGSTAEARNVISGNLGEGIEIFGSLSDANIIQGNFIGVNASGTDAIGNRLSGIFVPGPTNTHILDNVVSGNLGFAGIAIYGGNPATGDTSGTVIQGNFVGTNASGNAAVANLGYGISIDSGTGRTIGGLTDADRNIISGNGLHGVYFFNGATGDVVEGNYIGTIADGTSALGNGGSGVQVENASELLIGGVGDESRNVISGNSAGVAIEGPLARENHVSANYIGVGSDGVTRVENLDGVVVSGDAAENLIGGMSVGERNVISGNTRAGLFVTGTESTWIQGNYIGTDATGTLAVANRSVGVILLATTDTVIGGTHPEAGNLISGNGVGIAMGATIATRSTRVEGNRIGTNADGREALGNNIGIQVTGSAGCQVVDATIGGLAPGAGNLISGNATQGILVRGEGASEIRIQGNLIGTDIDGDGAIGNGASGILIQDANGVQIGGTEEPAANLISGNLGNGISVTGNAVGNTIRGNSIYANGGLGIDLGGDGVTPNDKGDLAAGIFPDEDTGANTLQNFPEISNVQPGLETQVTGILRSTPGASFVIDFYANATADPMGYGEGKRWLGSTQGIVDVIPNDEGVAHFKLSLPATTYGGEWITATATRLIDNDGDPATPLVFADTSEFSAAYQIKSGKGNRGPDTFVLQIPTLDGGTLGETVNLDVQLVSVASSELAGTEIDVETFLAAIQHPESGGPPIGLPFKLSAEASALSPLLLMAAAQGQQLGHIELVGSSTINGVPFEFARWSLDDAILGSFAELGAQQDQFTLLYDAVQYSFTPLDARGFPGTPVVGTWDVTASGGVVAQTFPNLSELPSPVDTFHYYVNIPGIPGDATQKNYADWIEASSFEFGVRGPEISSATTARASTFNFIAQSGSASSLLLQSLADGDIFTSPIEIVATRDSKIGPVEVASWNLDYGRIVAYQTVSGLVDGFSLAFDAVHYTAVDFRDDGTMDKVTADWNLADSGTKFAITPIDLDQATENLPAVETFLYIPGVEGPSQTTDYAGWIPIDEFRFAVERSPEDQSPSGLEASSFRFTTSTDIASPKLFELLVTGETLNEPVELALTSPLKGTLNEFARWSLNGAMLGHFATASAVLDSFTLGFESVQSQFLPPDGKTTLPPITGELNLGNGGAVNDAPLDLPEEPTLADGVVLLVNIPGITGSSNWVGYSGWIPVDSFQFELSRSFALDSPPTPYPFRFNAHSSNASPEILRRLTTGELIKGVQLVAVKQTGGSKVTVLSRWSFSDGQIAGFATESGLGDAFSLTFASLEYTYYRRAAKSGVLIPVSARWDRSLQEAIFVTDELTPPVPEIPENFRVLVQIPGIVGSSQLVGYAGWIEVDMARFSALRTRQGTLSNSYATAFQFLTDTDIASPQLLEAVLDGRVFSEGDPIRIATVHIDKAGPHEVATWVLNGATITSYSTDSGWTDGFSIAFNELAFTWTPELIKGGPLPPITVAWNLESTDTELIDVGPPLLPELLLPSDVTLLVHLPGVTGDSTRKGYADWIELDSFAFQFAHPANSTDPVGSLLTFQTDASQASPQLFAAVAQGLVFSVVDLVAIRDSMPLEVFQISLDQVRVASFQTADSQSDWLALEFDRLHFSYGPSDNFGTPGFNTQVVDAQAGEIVATATNAADNLSEVSAASEEEMLTSKLDVPSETFVVLVGDSTVVPSESANREELVRIPISPQIERLSLAATSPPDELGDEIPEEKMLEFVVFENEDGNPRDSLFANLEDELFDQLLLVANH